MENILILIAGIILIVVGTYILWYNERQQKERLVNIMDSHSFGCYQWRVKSELNIYIFITEVEANACVSMLESKKYEAIKEYKEGGW